MMLAVVAASVSFASCGTRLRTRLRPIRSLPLPRPTRSPLPKRPPPPLLPPLPQTRSLPTLPLLRNKFGRPAREASFAGIKDLPPSGDPLFFCSCGRMRRVSGAGNAVSDGRRPLPCRRYPERYGRVSGMLRSDGSRTCGGTPGPAPKSGTVRNVKRGCPTYSCRAASSLSSFCGPIATWRSSVPGLRGGS